MVWVMKQKLIEEGYGEIYYNGELSWNVGGIWRKKCEQEENLEAMETMDLCIFSKYELSFTK